MKTRRVRHAVLITLLVASAASAADTTGTAETPEKEPAATATKTAGGAGAALLGLLRNQGIVDAKTAETLAPHLELLEKQLGEGSDTPDNKVTRLLASPEAEKLKQIVAEVASGKEGSGETSFSSRLAGAMQLSHEQLKKLRPIIDQGVTELRIAAGEALAEGKTSWQEFRPQYTAVMQKMRSRLQGSVSSGQLQKFDSFLEAGADGGDGGSAQGGADSPAGRHHNSLKKE